MIKLKRKKYFVIAFLTIVCLLIGDYFANRENLTKNSDVLGESKQDATKSQENMPEDKLEPVLEITENEKSSRELQEIKIESTKETNVTNTKSIESTKEITKDVPKKPEDITEKKESETKDEKQDDDILQQNQKVTEKTPWEQLGLTEDEYYNQPSIKSQKVTHKSFDECVAAGNAAIGMDGNNSVPSEYYSFSCYDVVSPSGRYLGEMLVLV